jgi:GNAT superfamily N-acetyltransferase
MNVTVEDLGGHATIFVDGVQVGFINYAHYWHRDISEGMMPKGYVYSAMLVISPQFRRKGVGTTAYKIWAGIRRKDGDRVIAGLPKTPRSEQFMRKLGFRKMDIHSRAAYERYGVVSGAIYELKIA